MAPPRVPERALPSLSPGSADPRPSCTRAYEASNGERLERDGQNADTPNQARPGLDRSILHRGRSQRRLPSVARAQPWSIGGTVFEDVNFGGGAGRDRLTSAGVGRQGARVELYSSTAAYVTAITTDVSGNYFFSNLSGASYTVRIVNGSVSSSRSGYVAGTHLAVQTFRTSVTTGTAQPVTDFVGGQNPVAGDAANGFPGVTMNTTTGAFTAGLAGVAQSITRVTGTADVSGVDFGFNFDVIVNTNNAGQGSFRQFLLNANALVNAGLAQDGRSAGMENAVFMIPDGTARPGANTGYPNLFSGGVATIALTSSLPDVTSPVFLDARTQAGWTGVPIIELKGTSAGTVDALTITAGNSAIHGFVIDAFNGNAIVLSGGGFNTVTSCYLGTVSNGSAASSNNRAGILINASPGNQIGGASIAFAQRHRCQQTVGHRSHGSWSHRKPDPRQLRGHECRGHVADCQSDGRI